MYAIRFGLCGYVANVPIIGHAGRGCCHPWEYEADGIWASDVAGVSINIAAAMS